jgi:transcriptional regulator with XRE-family HTH domain
MSFAERFDLGEDVIHSGGTMRRICPSVKPRDGYVRKLRRARPSPMPLLVGSSIDLELVKSVLREATQAGRFSQRGLSRKAGLDRDAVYDILNGRNKNPTISVLLPLAEAMDADLSVFGLAEPEVIATVSELQRAIAEALPNMPSRGVERQARYLAEVVAGELGLPKDQPASTPEHHLD